MLVVRALAKRFAGGAPLFEALELDVSPGEFVAILGESGSGKSTLLNLVAGLDRPDSGDIRVAGVAITGMDDDRLARWRRSNVGFVFQAFHLLPYLTVEENVALPLLIAGTRADERRERAQAALASVGLAGCARRRPASLSGGEAQRVAVARAVVHRPPLVLADEPTGNLDESSAAQTMQALRDAVKRENAAGLLVTHSLVAAASADRVLRLAGRRLGPA
jgi:putative ABC transport system ATP-binding protein